MARKITLNLRSDRVDDYFNYCFRNARVERGYSMKQLAELVGVSIPTICSYERLRRFPNPLIARRLARILHKKANELFPIQLRDYAREIRRERRGNINDALSYSKSITKKLERTLVYIPEHDNAVQREELVRRIREVLETLTYRERELVKLRWGIGDGYSYTLEEVGNMFKVTKDRIRQIEAKVIRKLQQPSRSKELVNFLDDC